MTKKQLQAVTAVKQLGRVIRESDLNAIAEEAIELARDEIMNLNKIAICEFCLDWLSKDEMIDNECPDCHDASEG